LIISEVNFDKDVYKCVAVFFCPQYLIKGFIKPNSGQEEKKGR